MQTIEFFDKPSPHIVIDNFLTPKLAKLCLEESIKLEPFYQDANVQEDTDWVNHLEECQECKRNYEYNRNNTRENDVVYLDNLFNKKRNQSIILKALHDTVTSHWFENLINKNGFWHILRHTNSSETILSRYGKCDFYGWHTDTLHNNRTGRMVTLCYYLNEEPEQFEGGDLIITGNDIHDNKKLKPKHNRAIIFQSDTTFHSVDTVKLKNDNFSSGRFSINFWLGFTNNFQYR